MRRRMCITALLIVAAGGSMWSRVADPRSSIELKRLGAVPDASVLSTVDPLPEYIPMIIEIKDDSMADSVIRELGAKVYHFRSGLYLTSVPVANLDKIPHYDRVIKLQVATHNVPHLDVARSVAGVDRVHSGYDIDRAYNGGGVVAGICDVGFDPRHKAFRTALKRWVHIDEFNAKVHVYDCGDEGLTPEAPLTDDPEITHATHVANILVGNSEGAPYNGVAPGASFVATTSNLTDVGILAGIEHILAYADSVGAPAVVNISAGSYLGPHDGTDLAGRYISELAKEGVICFSAGNFGTREICGTFHLDEYSEPIGLAFCDMSWTGMHVAGGVDLWSAGNSPFDVRIVARDMETKEYIVLSDWMAGKGGEGEATINLGQTAYFNEGSEVMLSWGENDISGRFNVAIDYDYATDSVQTAGPWGRYFVGFQLRKSVPGTTVTAYADGIRSFFHPNFSLRATSDGSISNFACNPDVIAVGAWNTRNVVPDTKTGTRMLDFELNRVAEWTSWGTSGDGRRLPHFCAPGNTVVSAMSTPYFMAENDPGLAVAYEQDGYRWYAENGTSMAAPYAAGVIALWLEADPTLTVNQVRDIAMNTCKVDFDDIDNPRWGAGAINAHAGMKEVLARLGSGDVRTITNAPTAAPYIDITDGRVNVYWPEVPDPVVNVFTMTGGKVAADRLVKGNLYIVKVSDKAGATTAVAKIMAR